ncbi:16309_t:CDS:2, partial [Cetraspora pellucida]
MNYNNSSSPSNQNENYDEFTLKELIENNKRKNLSHDVELDEIQRVLLINQIDITIRCHIAKNTFYQKDVIENIEELLKIKQFITVLSKDDIIKYLDKVISRNMDLNEELKKTLENNQMKKLLFSTIYQTILYNLDYGQPHYTEIFQENIEKIIEIKQEVRNLSKDDLLEYIETVFYLN